MKSISVTFCSRGRPDSLREALASLQDNAVHPDDIEYLIGVDPDDPATANAALAAGAIVWVAPERYGYYRLHDYLNPLTDMAQGTWCQWWNDDMRMQTQGWDEVILANRPAYLWPYANHVPHANIAPAWPRAWAEATGHASPSSHMDTYMQWLGERLGRHDRINVHILHDRADVTGHHNDATYAEGRQTLGSEGMVPGFDHAGLLSQIAIDADVIRSLL